MPTVWISRPPARAIALAQALAANNIEPLLVPAMRIADADDSTPLTGYLAAVEEFSASIFVSREASQRVAKVLPAGGALAALAIGEKTAAALAARYRLLAPAAALGDSRCLLQSEALQQCRGRLAVLGGTDENDTPPSPMLIDALGKRGNDVLAVACYRRLPAAANPELTRRGQSGQLAAAVAYSGDSLRYMLRMNAPDNDWLKRLPLFVIHTNIAATARQLGFAEVVVGDDNSMAALIARRLAGAP